MNISTDTMKKYRKPSNKHYLQRGLTSAKYIILGKGEGKLMRDSSLRLFSIQYLLQLLISI